MRESNRRSTESPFPCAAAVRKGVRALEDFAGAQGPGSNSRNAHLWDGD